MRRNRNFIGPQGMGGMVSLWGASSMIHSLQKVTLTLVAASSGTASITAVDMSRSILVFANYYTDWAGTVSNTSFNPRVSLTNSTTITATDLGAATGGVTTPMKITVIEFAPGVIRSVQRGVTNLTNVTTNSTTITGVNTAKSFLNCVGWSTNSSEQRLEGIVELAGTTTVTITNAVAAGAVSDYSWEVVEYF